MQGLRALHVLGVVPSMKAPPKRKGNTNPNTPSLTTPRPQ